MAENGSIIVGTDGSQSADRALKEAIRMAKALGCSLHVVSAFTPRSAKISGAPEGAARVWAEHGDSEAERTLDRAAAVARLEGVEVQTHAVQGDPADALLEVCGQLGAEMIVVGNRGMHGARRFVIGSVPNKISHRATCDVLIV